MKDDAATPPPGSRPSPADRAAAIFDGALQLAAAQRPAYVGLACGEDARLREQVESLLQAHDQAGAFLEPPAASSPNPTIALSLPLTEKPGDRIGDYRLLQQIGEGGCGVVYMAEQEQPVRRRVALKVIKLGMDTRQVVARFEAERQALALMDHPNIAKVLDAGATEAGRPFFVMELVRGIKITEYCDQNKLTADERLGLFIQVCHALQHAHQKGIIHRDIKPSNILVTVNDGVPVPKVIDFGIAKATEQRLTDKTLFTAFEQFIGTPAYMSPEQAVMTSLDIDTRTDIYSLGVLLYELLTGQTPFDARELAASGLDKMRQTIREQEPQRPSTRLQTMLNADLTATASRHGTDAPKLVHLVRGDLDWIVMKALEKDRTRRYETAAALATDVQRNLDNEPVEACPPSTLYRFQKLVRRNQLAFAAAAAVVAALALGFGVSTVLFFQERAARQRAVAAEQEQSRLRERAEQTAALETRLRLGAEITKDVGMAAFLLTQRQYDEAERSINKVPLSSLPRIITNYPATAAIFNALGEKHARQGDWPGAISNYAKVADSFPSDPIVFHQLAPLLAETADAKGYQHYCEQILGNVAGSSSAAAAAAVPRDCLLLPLPRPALETAGKLADAAMAMAGADASAEVMVAKGLADYRRGNFSGAAAWLQQACAKDANRYVNLESLTALAMAQFQLQQVELARKTLAEGVDRARRKLPKPGEDEFRDGWNDVLVARVLLREAKALIENGPPAAGPSK